MPRLKVYCTAIGFHDVYVAAPSQKAALAAWGSDKDLFARGAADVVTDPALTEEPLAHPGKVIRKSRGSLAEQLRALGPSRRETPVARKTKAEPRPREKPKPKRKRRAAPSRAAIEAAEQELAEGRAAAEHELAAIRREEEKLARRRRAIERKLGERIGRLEARLATSRETYRSKFERWSAEIADDD